MGTMSIADAKAHLSDLIDRVEAGEEICITRRGKPVAQLTTLTPARKRIDARLLRALTSTLPASGENAGDVVRSMRNGDRY